MAVINIANKTERRSFLGKCQNSGQGGVTEGMYPHVSLKKATQCSHFPHSLLILEVVSPLCLSFFCRVLSSDTSSYRNRKREETDICQYYHTKLETPVTTAFAPRGHQGASKDSLLGQPFAPLKSHLQLNTYLLFMRF